MQVKWVYWMLKYCNINHILMISTGRKIPVVSTHSRRSEKHTLFPDLKSHTLLPSDRCWHKSTIHSSYPWSSPSSRPRSCILSSHSWMAVNCSIIYNGSNASISTELDFIPRSCCVHLNVCTDSRSSTVTWSRRIFSWITLAILRCVISDFANLIWRMKIGQTVSLLIDQLFSYD